MGDIYTVCAICGIDSNQFDRFGKGFQHHIFTSHNIWNYAYFYVHLMRKARNEYTGPELHVWREIERGSVDWFPTGQAIELLEVSAREAEANNAVQLAVERAVESTSVPCMRRRGCASSSRTARQ